MFCSMKLDRISGLLSSCEKARGRTLAERISDVDRAETGSTVAIHIQLTVAELFLGSYFDGRGSQVARRHRHSREKALHA